MTAKDMVVVNIATGEVVEGSMKTVVRHAYPSCAVPSLPGDWRHRPYPFPPCHHLVSGRSGSARMGHDACGLLTARSCAADDLENRRRLRIRPVK